MEPNETESPKNQRKEPIDATGLFWAIVLILLAIPWGMAGPFFAGIPLSGAAYCVIWQFRTWDRKS